MYLPTEWQLPTKAQNSLEKYQPKSRIFSEITHKSPGMFNENSH